jgi:hypothetical protein
MPFKELPITQEGLKVYYIEGSLNTRIEVLKDPYEYMFRISHLITKDKNSSGRCWFRAKFPDISRTWGV